MSTSTPLRFDPNMYRVIDGGTRRHALEPPLEVWELVDVLSLPSARTATDRPRRGRARRADRNDPSCVPDIAGLHPTRIEIERPPGPSASTITGIRLLEEIERNSGLNCSPFARLTGMTL